MLDSDRLFDCDIADFTRVYFVITEQIKFARNLITHTEIQDKNCDLISSAFAVVVRTVFDGISVM